MAVNAELSEDSKHIIVDAEWRYKEIATSIPGMAWNNKGNHWRIPTSWSACLALRSTFREALVIGPNLSQWAYNELNTRVNPSNALREATELSWGDEDLFPHQKAGVEFLATAHRALLADEPGLGKTAQSIRGLKRAHDLGWPVFPAMIVCPNSLKINWEREFEKWWPEVRVQVIDGNATQRRKQFDTYLNPKEGEEQPQVIVMNWESLRFHSMLAPYGSVGRIACVEHGGKDPKVNESRCELHEGELNKIPFNAVIADEIHRSKDPKSKQSRALLAATGDAEFRFALTGTPIANDVVDLWAILHWLDPIEWPSKTKWIDRMVQTMNNAFGGLVVIGIRPEMRDEFFATINPRFRRMLKKIVMPFLPPILNDVRVVEMSPKQKKAYKQMVKHMIAEVDGGQYVRASNDLTQMARLVQFASAYAEVEWVDEVDQNTGEIVKKDKVRLSEPSASIDAFMNDIENGDFGEDSIAVSAVSKQLINLLSARLTKAKIPHGLITGDTQQWERQKAVDDFQAGITKFVLFTAQAGGVGITLTKARRLVRLQRPMSLVDDKQVNDRVHRIGSEKLHTSIVITDYLVRDTVHTRVAEILDEKGGKFEDVVADDARVREFLTELEEAL